MTIAKFAVATSNFPLQPPRYGTLMADRDVELGCPTPRFIETLRRLADALEKGESFRIQVGNARFTVPCDARMSIEREASAGDEELELQMSWKR